MAFDWNKGTAIKPNQPTKTGGFDFSKGTTVNFPPQAPPEVHQSFMQKLGALTKTVGNALTSSEQILGSGLSTVGSNIPKQQLDQTGQNTNNVSQLLQIYHSSTDPIQKQHLANALKAMGTDVMAGDINKGFDLSNKDVVGAALGTALDIASAGSYGKAAQGAESGKLLVKSGGVAENLAAKVGVSTTQKVVNPVAEQIAKKTLTETLKDIGKKTAVRSVVGGATGYGYDVSNNLQSGKSVKDSLKPGTGTALGAAIPLAIGGIEATKAVTKETAPRIINSLVKPKQADFAYGKNPGRTVSELGITGNNLEDFGKNVGQARQEVGSQIGAIYASPENSSKAVNLQPDIQKIDQAMQDAAKGGKNNQGIVTTLQNLKDALLYDHKVNADGSIIRIGDTPADLSNIDLKQAFDLKQKVADATQFTGRPSDDKTVNSVLKNIYSGIKEKLNGAVGETNPEITKLNQQYADLTSAEIAIKNRDKIVQRANLVSVKSGGAGAIATTIALLSGAATLPAALVGVGGAVLEKALETTAVKTRIAAWLGSQSPDTIAKILDKNPQIKTVLLRALPKFASKIGTKRKEQ